jgi:hypothetical protein
MWMEPVPETLENFHTVTRLSAREHFIEFCRHENLKTYMKPFLGGSVDTYLLVKKLILFTINSYMFRRLYERHYQAKPL